MHIYVILSICLANSARVRVDDLLANQNKISTNSSLSAKCSQMTVQGAMVDASKVCDAAFPDLPKDDTMTLLGFGYGSLMNVYSSPGAGTPVTIKKMRRGWYHKAPSQYRPFVAVGAVYTGDSHDECDGVLATKDGTSVPGTWGPMVYGAAKLQRQDCWDFTRHARDDNVLADLDFREADYCRVFVDVSDVRSTVGNDEVFTKCLAGPCSAAAMSCLGKLKLLNAHGGEVLTHGYSWISQFRTCMTADDSECQVWSKHCSQQFGGVKFADISWRTITSFLPQDYKRRVVMIYSKISNEQGPRLEQEFGETGALVSIEPSHDEPIPQSYVDVILTGILLNYGFFMKTASSQQLLDAEQAVVNWVRNTALWGPLKGVKVWTNDRDFPLGGNINIRKRSVGWTRGNLLPIMNDKLAAEIDRMIQKGLSTPLVNARYDMDEQQYNSMCAKKLGHVWTHNSCKFQALSAAEVLDGGPDKECPVQWASQRDGAKKRMLNNPTLLATGGILNLDLIHDDWRLNFDLSIVSDR